MDSWNRIVTLGDGQLQTLGMVEYGYRVWLANWQQNSKTCNTYMGAGHAFGSCKHCSYRKHEH